MKRIGLLGGMSWESSIEYYRLVNEITRDRLGGLHSADCLLRSVDFAEIELLQRDGRWDEAGERLAAEARALVAGGAELLVLCTMEQDFYVGRLRDVHGLQVLVPGEADRQIVHDVIYDELCVGVVREESREQYRRIMRELHAQRAVELAA